MYRYYQAEGGHHRWQVTLDSTLPEVLKKQCPQFVGALALDRVITDDIDPEELPKIRYRGPFYVDFDHKEDCLKVIESFQQFLRKLQAEDVDLECLNLYATGGKGFHIEVPPEVFLEKPSPRGYAGLPHVYKAMARALLVDTLDLSVYSAKRGRMWRVANVKRDNNHYKVPISLAEAWGMTELLYHQLTSTPRTVISPDAYESRIGEPGLSHYVPAPHPPSLASGLATLYRRCEQEVQDGLKRQKRAVKATQALRKFKGKWPPTLQAILCGVGLNPDAGWNEITLQIGITANALGITDDDEVVRQAKDLIESHHGTRYRTPAEREEWLRQQLAWTRDNPQYVFAVAPIRKLLDPEIAAVDLEGITDEEVAKDIAQAKQQTRGGHDGDDSEEAEQKDPELERGVVVGRTGIRQLVGGEWVQWCGVGFDEILLLYNIDTAKPLMYEATIYVDGVARGRVGVLLDVFMSRQKFHAFVSAETGMSFQGNDQVVQAVQETFRNRARANHKENTMQLTLRREGLDLIEIPSTMDAPEVARKPFLVWGSPYGCYAPPHIAEAGVSFRFYGDGKPQGVHESDLLDAPELSTFEGTDRIKAVATALFHINEPRVIGPVLGWSIASFARPLYHKYKNAFPLLMLAGEKGAGKSTTMYALGRFFFFRNEFKNNQAFAGTTIFGVQELLMASSSVPVQLDEYKPRMYPDRAEPLRGVLRAAYNAGVVTKGGGVQNALSSQREITSRRMMAPVIYMGETLETESATQDRSIGVPFKITGHKGREKQLQTLYDNGEVLSALGRTLVQVLLSIDYEEFCKSFDKDYALARTALFSGSNDRIVYNYAVALHGLTMLQELLKHVGVDHLDEEFQVLRDAVLEGPFTVNTGRTVVGTDGKMRFETISEVAKTLKSLAVQSQLGTDRDGTRIVAGQDYAYDESGDSSVLELNLPFIWAKHLAWCRSKATKPLYDTEEAFIFAMQNYQGYIDSVPGKLINYEQVARFRVEVLNQTGVPDFNRSKPIIGG
jgi:hypothetical protein